MNKKMRLFEFEIQELLKVTIYAESKIDARQKVIQNLEYKMYNFEYPYVSDGEEIEEEEE